MAEIDSLFEHINKEILDEETKLQMAVLFENAVQDAIVEKEKQLEEANTKEMVSFKENLTTQINEYLSYFAEEFVKTNSNVIEESVKVKTAEKVIKTFTGIVKDFHFQLDEKVVSDETKLKEAKEEINSITKQLIEAKKAIKKGEKAVMISEAASKLTTDLQKAKLAEYAKNLVVDDLFEKKLGAYVSTVLVEKKVETPTPEKIVIKEEQEPVVIETKSEVSQYLDRL